MNTGVQLKGKSGYVHASLLTAFSSNSAVKGLKEMGIKSVLCKTSLVLSG